MTIIPKYENIKAEDSKMLAPKQIAVECKLSAEPDSLIKNVLSVTSDVQLLSAEAMSGEIMFNGRADFKAMYEDTNGAVNTLTFYADFTDKMQDEMLTPLSRVDVTMSVVDSNIASVTPEELKIVCVIEVCVKINNNTQMPILSGGEGFFHNTASSNLSAFAGNGKGICEVSEEFEVKHIIKKILLSDASVIAYNVTAGVDSVMVEGEVVVKLNYLTESANGEEMMESVGGNIRVMPFKHEVEAKDVLPGDKAFADCIVKTLKVNALVDDEKGSTLIELTAEIEINIRAYSNNCVSYVDDVFAPQCNLNVTYLGVNSKLFIESFNFKYNIEGVVTLDDDMLDCDNILSTSSSRIHIANVITNEGFIIVEGVAVTTIVYSTLVEDKMKIASVNIEIPFSEKLEMNAVRMGDSVNIHAVIYDIESKCRKGRAIEVSMQIKLRADLFTNEVVTVISDVEAGDTEMPPQSSISIYCPSENERLWDIAKQLSVDPNTVLAFNPEIQFPLPNDARILVYRQKF